MLNLGAMRHDVVIERRTVVKDSAGEPEDTWVLVARRRAELVRAPGAEVWASASRNARVPTLFKLRFTEGIEPQMRLTSGGKLYDIVSAVDPDGRRAELLVTCSELVGKSP